MCMSSPLFASSKNYFIMFTWQITSTTSQHHSIAFTKPQNKLYFSKATLFEGVQYLKLQSEFLGWVGSMLLKLQPVPKPTAGHKRLYWYVPNVHTTAHKIVNFWDLICMVVHFLLLFLFRGLFSFAPPSHPHPSVANNFVSKQSGDSFGNWVTSCSEVLPTIHSYRSQNGVFRNCWGPEHTLGHKVIRDWLQSFGWWQGCPSRS